MRAWLRRPLLHFFLIGAALQALDTRLDAAQESPPPALSDEELLYREARALGLQRSDPLVRRRLVGDMRFAGAEPAASDAALFADALALGLDERDLVVRRRLVQRLVLDLSAQARRREPSESELADYLALHAERFAAPARLQLSQLFLSRERRGDALAEDARALLAELRAARAGPELAAGRGDPLPLPAELGWSSRQELAASFGEDFADAAFALEPGAWRGPLGSSYGLHLVFVRAREPSRLPPLAVVEAAVREALLEERAAALLEEKLRWLRAGY